MRARWYGALLVGALIAAGCTDDASPPISTVELTTTVVVQETTTIAPATSTTVPESTAPPTSSQEEIEAELIATLDGGNEVFLDIPIDPDNPRIDRYFGGDLAETVSQAFAARAEVGDTYKGDFVRISIWSIEINGDSAIVIDCGLDRLEIFTAEGDLIVEADAQAFVRHHELIRDNDGLWRAVAGSFGPEKRTCAE